MTIGEIIKDRVNELEPRQQRALLTFLETLETPRADKPRSAKKGRSRKAQISAAVRGIAGMWSDRTDLPKDSIAAVKVLRARMSSRGAMPDTLIDSTIMIDATNNHPKALAYIEKLLLADEGFTHAQVAAEVISGTRDSREQVRLIKFLRQFKLLHPNEVDSESALQYLTRFHLSHDLGHGDCVIGSTALRLSLPVATLNVRDFRLFPGLKVIRPY